MPTNISKQSSTSNKLDAYYEAAIQIVTMIDYWPQDDEQIQEYLDYGCKSVQPPEEFEDLREAFASLYLTGRRLGLHEYLGERQIRALVRNLYRSKPRRKSYLETLRRKRSGNIRGADVIPFRELEERYQFRLWYKEYCLRKGKRVVIKFSEWRKKNKCVTFYDHISPDSDALIR